jgi:hypothetical protein
MQPPTTKKRVHSSRSTQTRLDRAELAFLPHPTYQLRLSVLSLNRDASLLEQTIQQHVEASKVGYRSSNSTSHPSSPVNDHRRFNLSDTSSTTSHHSQRRQNSVSSTTSRRSGGGGGGRQQQQTPQEEQGFQVPSSDHFRSGHEELSFLRDR